MVDSPEHRIAARLEQVFQTIYEQRMAQMSMVNTRLGIHAVGFQPWQDNYIGVLSTPWFMNLMLMPGSKVDWSGLTDLSNQLHQFPSGQYQFIVTTEPELGRYQMHSLFSPMFAFHDDSDALEAATSIIEDLMRPPSEYSTEAVRTELNDQKATQLSRRDLLRGAFGEHKRKR